MAQEDKELLLKDLSARLPYGTLCFCKWANDVPNGTDGCVQEISTYLIDEIEIMDDSNYECQICNVKPYLRPMSSMTEEEREEYQKFLFPCPDYNGKVVIGVYHRDLDKVYDWLNAHHFDYRGLIEKGLALEAPEGMYNITNS